MPTDVYAARRCQLAQQLGDSGADGVICVPSLNLEYLTGLQLTQSERHFLLIVPAAGDAHLLVPTLYETQVADTTSIDSIRTWADSADPVVEIKTLLSDLDIHDGQVGIHTCHHAHAR
mgnify:CR=1 FL=1